MIKTSRGQFSSFNNGRDKIEAKISSDKETRKRTDFAHDVSDTEELIEEPVWRKSKETPLVNHAITANSINAAERSTNEQARGLFQKRAIEAGTHAGESVSVLVACLTSGSAKNRVIPTRVSNNERV